jgi:hypothetical protein
MSGKENSILAVMQFEISRFLRIHADKKAVLPIIPYGYHPATIEHPENREADASEKLDLIPTLVRVVDQR